MATLIATPLNLKLSRAGSRNVCGTIPPPCRSLTATTRVSPFAAAPSSSRATVARSIPVSGPGAGVAGSTGGQGGQVTNALMDSMRAKICEALETDTCTVTDLYGDGRHVSIDVVSKAFEGKNSMQRQRMVYKAIWLELQEAVHAVDSMNTKTPQELGA